MRTKTVGVYKFSELSEVAKDRAKQNYASLFGYSWADEAIQSLKALAVHFCGKLKDYEVDWFDSSYSNATFDMPKMEANEIELLLASLGSHDAKTLRGNGDCVLTGYCADESAIDGFRMAWHKGERDLNALMQAAFDSWLKDCQADCKSFYEDEQFSEHCEANGYEFDENGNAE